MTVLGRPKDVHRPTGQLPSMPDGQSTLALIKMLKRKKPKEKVRNFQPDWTDEFAFVERAGSAICLLCNEKIASMKRCNVKRHFDTHHAQFAAKYPM